jgi:hypothetical protein
VRHLHVLDDGGGHAPELGLDVAAQVEIESKNEANMKQKCNLVVML